MLAIYPGGGARFQKHVDNTARDGRRLTVGSEHSYSDGRVCSFSSLDSMCANAHLSIYPSIQPSTIRWPTIGLAYALMAIFFSLSLTKVLCYLNESWDAKADGGALRMHETKFVEQNKKKGGQQSAKEVGVAREVDPLGGRIALFWSDAIPHEVIMLR